MSEATLQNTDGAGAARTRGRGDRRYAVDLWATDLNDVEFGLFRHTKHRAKSEQFTKDMDVIGDVKRDGQRTGVLAYRSDLWRKTEGAKRRLVLKLFSSTMNWRGTMDMMVGRSLQQTHGADGVPVLAYSVNLSGQDQVIQLERSADQWMFWPEKFSFFIMDEKGPRFYKLRQNLLSIGRDYVLYDQQNRRIGYVDGKLASIGCYWRVRVKPEHDDPKLDATLQLFCASLRFNKAARRHVSRLARDLRRGRASIAFDAQERDLYLNPRRRR